MVGPLLLAAAALAAQDAAAPEEEADFYRLITVPQPEGVVLEVGGMALLPDGRPIVCTRRGQVWVVDNAFAADAEEPGVVRYTLFAEGLQETLGLLVHEGWIYTVQRGELSRMRDVDGDDRMDELETVADPWHISGNYHEYNFGPRLGPDGRLWITTNKPFGGEPFGRANWRGFALSIGLDGTWEPVCCGLRSPAGIQNSPWGDVFYTDNQGEWCGASKLSLLRPGSCHGHPWGMFSCEESEWTYGDPGDPPDGVLMPDVHETIPSFELPAVWFPYDKTGRSPSGFVWDQTDGAFGPFAGQVFVGDQYAAMLLRVYLEEVGGRYQGAVFPFRRGLASGVIRVAWGTDQTLMVGMSDRGWPSLGSAPFGLQRVAWTGKMPFEIHEMRARPDGFELTFTRPIDPATAEDPSALRMESYTYRLHASYGSAEMETQELDVVEARPSEDGLTLRLKVDGLRAGYVHELHLPELRSADGQPLLHDDAYYTLIEIPE
ncbi:MAG: hypothetical protein AAF682_09330 [Planctomycetota bacterium]